MKPLFKPDLYFSSEYDTPERFMSYWHQINEISSRQPESVLEIGIGNGFVADYLKKIKNISVTTLDIDKRLSPDFVGSVLKLPFDDGSFEMVACFEVLEHLPYENFAQAISEIFRVSRRYVVLSLPNTTNVYRLYIHVPKMKDIKKLIPIPMIKKRIHRFDEQHYWEIGEAGYPLKKIVNQIKQIGFRIEKSHRPFECSYHRFFILAK